ncbi:MAG TPA: enoyl-CoA hydratase [Micromonosporaceae bacterium]|nr:enoyl-CoA hydratase [Micromonosporaceae bacterium]HCU50647.1 enoyl-CoA hydratase [Micromonosporaceae bacterium]
MTDFDTLSITTAAQGVATLTLTRSAQLNALNVQMLSDLIAACAVLHRDRAVNAVVLTGEGKGFCAGYDLEEAGELAELSPEGMLERQDLAAEAILALRTLRQPVVAAINGATIGGGLSLALAADIRIAAPSAVFSAAFVRLGLSGGDMGCSWHLPRLVGVGQAAELMLTGKQIDAAEAARIGLVNNVAANVVPEATSTAAAIAKHSPFGIALTKRALYANLDAPLTTGLELESRGQAFATRDHRFPEALAAVRAQVARHRE